MLKMILSFFCAPFYFVWMGLVHLWKLVFAVPTTKTNDQGANVPRGDEATYTREYSERPVPRKPTRSLFRYPGPGVGNRNGTYGYRALA